MTMNNSSNIVYHCKCVYYIDIEHKFEAKYRCPTRRHARFLAADFVLLHTHNSTFWAHIIRSLVAMDQWEYFFDKGFVRIQIIAQVI